MAKAAASLSAEPVTVTAIRLNGLELTRFKGVREFALWTAGEDVAVYGDNAAGKTSLADAFAWLLFGKDSAGRADFELKTLDQNGEAVHGLDHEVSASLTVGDRQLELRKVYREKWQKRRGSADREFTGHTTDHFINGVPCKEKEYQATVAEIADEAVIRLLTDPSHFAERLHWQERRQILLEVCRDVPDSEVIASTSALADLPNILAGRSIDDHRKVAQSRRKSINTELQRVPVRIDEVSRGLVDAPLCAEDEEKGIRARLEALREQRSEAQRTSARIASGGEIAEKTKRLREIECEVIAESNKAGAAASEKATALRRAVAERQAELDAATGEAARLYRELKDADAEMASLETRMDERRARWHEIDRETFSPAVGAETCAACGQPLPAKKIEQARAKALASFNADKSRRLEELVSEGKRLRARADELAELNEKRGAARKEAEKRARELSTQVEALRQDYVNENARAEFPEASARQEALEAEKRRVELEIEHLRDSSAGARDKIDAEIGDLEDSIAAVQAELARIEQRRAAEKRVDELRKEERRLAVEFEGLERELYLLEEFTRRKVSMLTDRINARFALARFRLFETQINGSLSEVCEVSYQGVPWGSLNHGSRINVGLDIIRTLQHHYRVAPCIWIDQSESVTRLLDMDSQMIRLVVSEQDKTLRVEQKGESK